MRSIDELREISRRRIDSPTHQSILFIVDTVPTRIPEMSGPLCRDFHNVHKKYGHIKTQAVVDLDGVFIDISHTYRGSTSDITIFRDSGFGQHVVEGTTIAADAIYQGLGSELNGGSIMIPHRRDDVDFSQVSLRNNSFLSSFRVTIVHSFGQLKNFQIINFYRGDLWKFNSIFRICCALFNIRRGVALQDTRSQDGDYPHISVLEGRRVSTISDVVDDFVMTYHNDGDGEEEEDDDVEEDDEAFE